MHKSTNAPPRGWNRFSEQMLGFFLQGQESGVTVPEMTPPYIPAAEPAFKGWLDNFLNILALSAAAYGLVPSDLNGFAIAVTDYDTAYGESENPATRTNVTIAARVSARAIAERQARVIAMQVQAFGPSAALLTAAGLTVAKVPSTPVPPPQTEPDLGLVSGSSLAHKLQFRVPGNVGKAKPPGVTGIQIFRAVGTLPAIDASQATYLTTVTKSPFVVDFAAGDRGKIATYYGRYVTRSGPNGQASTGPFSVALVAGVM